MKIFSALTMILIFGVSFASPANAQSKYFAPGEDGLTIAGTHKGMSEYIDRYSSSGFGFIVDWSSKGRFDLGLEVVWREQSRIYPNLTHNRSHPDMRPFLAVSFLPESEKEGLDLVFSYTFVGDLRSVYSSPYDFDFERDATGSSLLFIGEYYYKFKTGSSVQIIPLLRFGTQKIKTEIQTNEGWHSEKSTNGLYMGAEISFLVKNKFYINASFSMFQQHDNWEGMYQTGLGLKVF